MARAKFQWIRGLGMSKQVSGYLAAFLQVGQVPKSRSSTPMIFRFDPSGYYRRGRGTQCVWNRRSSQDAKPGPPRGHRGRRLLADASALTHGSSSLSTSRVRTL